MPSAAPSAGASNGAASTSIAPHSVESIAKGPPRGGAAVAAPPSPLPCSSAVHASKRGADEQKPRRTLFWRSDAGRRTCETSEESGGSKAAPPSERAVVGLGAPVAPALAASAGASRGDVPLPEGRASCSAGTSSTRGTPSSTGGASRVAASSSAHSNSAPAARCSFHAASSYSAVEHVGTASPPSHASRSTSGRRGNMPGMSSSTGPVGSSPPALSR
mmetsp:Transcript_42373/g.136279  ORF Transcript_42373/g.136279 Transcript_42373/m.136279 type:complete len:218 (-) Transcript_42373:981-1634(-)